MSHDLNKAYIQDAQARFFDLALDIQCVVNAEGMIMLCNTAFAKMFGSTPEDIFGQTLQTYFYHPTEDIKLFFADLTLLERPTSFECQFQHFDADVHEYLMTIYPPKDGLCHLIGKDITPYRAMEHRESERNIFAEALLDTVLAINTSLALDKVLERILSNIGKVVAYDDVTIILVNNQQAEVVGNLRRDPYHLDVTLDNERSFQIDDYPSLQAMVETKDCLILPQVDMPPAWITTHHTHHEEGSVLGAPIIVDNRVIGFLGIFNTQREFFTPLHAQQTITFANQAGIALQNARLYEQAQSVAILRERQRVAQELHDSVNQDLFAASTYADLLPKALEKKPELVAKYALDVSRLVRSAVEQMRMILIELQPDTLTNMGLDLLIKRLSETYAKRMEIDIEFSSNDSFVLSEQHQLAFYRIAQEALHNIEKHARATCVTIKVSKVEHVVQFIIEDNGVGFHLDNIPDMHFGIRGMRDRAGSIGAEIKVETDINQGTKIILRKDYS